MLLGGRRMSERDMTRIGSDTKPPMTGLNPLLNSKSVPTLHHIGNYSYYFFWKNRKRSTITSITFLGVNKSRSVHNLANNTDQGFYQNLSVYRAQNQSQPNLGEKYVIHKQYVFNIL